MIIQTPQSMASSVNPAIFVPKAKVAQLNKPVENHLLYQNANIPVEQITTLLNSFASYQLSDLNNANLMDRVDSKFVLPISFLPELLAQLTNEYRVLDIDRQRCFTYYNQYFDTVDMALYRAHHNGKLNRFKVRRRHYVDTGSEFLEVKLKNNQQRTIKTRIKLSTSTSHASAQHHLDEEQATINAFIQQQMHNQAEKLQVSQRGGYRRIALANEQKAERLTLDFDLWYKNSDGTKTVKLPHFFIAELKQFKKSKQSPFYQLMSQQHIFPISFSKYCIGCALLFRSNIKSNRFKPALARIAALSNPNPTFLI